MFKKKRFWISLIIIIVTVCIGGLTFAGNYFIEYALYVDEDKMIGSMGGIPYEGKQDSQAQKDYDGWVAGVAQETLNIKSKDDLELWALYYHGAADSHTYILAVHGYTVDHRDIAPAIKPFVEKGYHVITPDQRGRGYSDGSYLGMGYKEKDDVQLWIKEILKMDSEAKIVLYGESMGASTVMMASGDNLSKNVVAMVEDCGYTSAYAMFEDQLKERFGLPAFPFLPAAQIVGQLRAGYNFSDASALEQMKTAKVPTLFIHGGKDTYVPTYMGQELFDAYKGPKQLLIVDGADHGASSDVNPKLYYETIDAFLAKYLK